MKLADFGVYVLSVFCMRFGFQLFNQGFYRTSRWGDITVGPYHQEIGLFLLLLGLYFLCSRLIFDFNRLYKSGFFKKFR